MNGPFVDLDALAARIPDGATVVLSPDYSGCAMAAVRRLIARGVRNLHLVGAPTLTLHGDMLVGAGCVRTVEAAAVTLGEHGMAPRFAAAVAAGSIQLRDSTCPAIHAALQAAEKGIPFMPLRGILGTDVLANRPDWKVMDNPFGTDDPIVLLPAIRPDVALMHVPLVDRAGNVWVGVRRELMLMAHAARETLVTFEAVHDGDLLQDDAMAAGTIPALYVTALAEAKQGAWPLGLFGAYAKDDENLAIYAQMARTEEGFRAYLDRFLAPSQAAAE